MFIKGIIYGLAISILYFWILSATVKRIFENSQAKRKTIFLLILYLIRFALFGIFVYIFVKYGVGDPIGFIIGVTIVLVGFIILKKKDMNND